MKAPTLYDVAALARVSHQTVSRVVKGQTNVDLELRRRIEEAVAELNYKPNRAARSLATAQSRRIAALFFDRLDEVGPTRSVQAAGDRAREAGYVLDIVGLDPRVETDIERAVALVDLSDLAGIMVFAPTERVRKAVLAMSFPVPVYIEFDSDDQIRANEAGTRALTDHLLNLGHTRVYSITGPLDWLAAKVRLDVLEQGLSAAHLALVGYAEGDWSAESGYRAASEMPMESGVTALVVGNDQMALGALKALEDRGVEVPSQISVVGFDDIPESRFYKPPLTTIGIDFTLQGRLAMNSLLSMIDPTISRQVLEPLVAHLRERDSTAGPTGPDNE